MREYILQGLYSLIPYLQPVRLDFRASPYLVPNHLQMEAHATHATPAQAKRPEMTQLTQASRTFGEKLNLRGYESESGR